VGAIDRDIFWRSRQDQKATGLQSDRIIERRQDYKCNRIFESRITSLEYEDCPSGALAVSVAWQSQESRRVKLATWIKRSGTENASRGASVTFFFGGDTAWCDDRLQVCRRLVVTSSGAELKVFRVRATVVRRLRSIEGFVVTSVDGGGATQAVKRLIRWRRHLW
jgi:hypothetical protein